MNKVTITVSGRIGSGKSAICGEIEIMCRALGLRVEWADGQEEKNLTYADWTEALEMYRPEVTIVEQIEQPASRSPAMAAEAVAIVDETDSGLFVEILYGENGSPLKCGDKLYTAPQPAQAAMPVLTNAMRAVITNESGTYQSADDLYAALCAAAGDERPAQADARVGLTDEQRTTIQHAADKLRTVWANHTGDKESRELCHKLEAILAGANHAE